MAILKEHAEKTLRSRIKRTNSDLVDATGEQATALTEYLAELKGQLATLLPLDGSDEAAEEDKARAHAIGMWCRENHMAHIATCPTSLVNYTRIDPTSGEVLWRPPAPENPGPAQVIGLGTIEAPGAVGGTAVA